MNKARRHITVRTDEILIIRTNQVAARISCSHCLGATLMVTPEEANALSGASIREICRWVEKGLAHFTESPGGALFICPVSILRLTLNSDEPI